MVWAGRLHVVELLLLMLKTGWRGPIGGRCGTSGTEATAGEQDATALHPLRRREEGSSQRRLLPPPLQVPGLLPGLQLLPLLLLPVPVLLPLLLRLLLLVAQLRPLPRLL